MNDRIAISPELASGFKDYLPEDMIPRQRMFDTIRMTFEKFGFVPLDTPGVEREEVLTGGDPNFKMQIFRTGLRTGDEGLALRFDLTVPLARVVSLYGDKITRPFKRYQTGKVWRGEKPQAGRFREFIQFDADIIGSDKMSADAEIVALMYETLTALGLDRFSIRVNNRKILNGLAGYVKYDQSRTPDVLRSIDKLDKIKWDGVMGELKEKASFTDEQLSRLKTFLDIRASSTFELLDGLSKLLADSPEAMKGVTELAEMSDNLVALGVPEKAWRIDLSVARGLGYYTGPVFETILDDLPSIGSVFSGGRYDDLVARFSERGVSATGASVGVDRLFAAMEQLNLVRREKTTAKVIVLNFDGTAEGYCQTVASTMRRSGLPTELYLGKESNLKGQLAYALGQSVPVIIIAGGSERDKKTVQIKDVARHQQTEMPLDEAPDKIKVILQDSNNVI
ncbi:MAG: histidine--tRNA ligase [Patescibacteria group bacterium]|nr:histidine--tRNA ligase [Patescibacteria group bacterium]